MVEMRHRPIVRTIVKASLAAGLWLAASLPSGFGIAQIAMFAGPGVVLAIAMSWGAGAASPGDWTWHHALRAAGFGAAVFPPFVALFFAWAGTFAAVTMVTLLVVSARLAVLGGLAVAIARLVIPSRMERYRAHAPHHIADTPARLVR
jgi:hypothetical protein